MTLAKRRYHVWKLAWSYDDEKCAKAKMRDVIVADPKAIMVLIDAAEEDADAPAY